MSKFNTLWALAAKTASVKTARLTQKDENGNTISVTPKGMPKVPTIAGVKEACAEGAKTSMRASAEQNGKEAGIGGSFQFGQVAAVKFIDAMFAVETVETEKESANV